MAIESATSLQVPTTMKPTVAIVAPEFDSASTHELETQLRSAGFHALACPRGDRRSTLRWVMDLPADEVALCIFCDNDGRTMAALSTALDTSISQLCWAPAATSPEQLPRLAYDLPIMVSFAKSAELLCQSLPTSLVSPKQENASSSIQGQRTTAAVHPIIRPETQQAAVTERRDYDPEDAAVYQQLETMMAAPIKKVVKQEPVAIQRPGLDFSNPLRQLMSHGRMLAQKSGSTEVSGAHYLAALDEAYSAELASAGLTRQAVDDYLSGLACGEDTPSEPIVSDEAFDAVSRAKVRARERSRSCIHIADFLAGLLEQADGSVAHLLHKACLSPDSIKPALAKLDEIEEPSPSPFFAPSSLDQDSFYEFDPAQVRTVEERLRTLPGFKKAAARVAEARTAQHGASANSPAAAAPVTVNVAAEPPEKPEIIKVSAVFPAIDDIEHIADRILEGQLVGFPSDTMYALAVDAANPAAIDRLREAASLPGDKPLSILINSTSQLKHLVRADLDSLEPLLDELWPGPLTLVFKAAGSIARHVSSTGTIAIRQPGDNTSLAILSMLGRPLAVTSWDDTEPHEPVDVSRLTDQLSGKAAIIVSHGEPVPQMQTTVVDLTTTPWTILREGAISAESVLQYQT